VLEDPKKRDLYDVLGADAMTYLLDSSQVDAMTVFNNFHKSSFIDRTKVLIYIYIALAYLLLQPILVCLKVDNVLTNIPWYMLLIPLWIFDLGALIWLIFRLERSVKRKGKWLHRSYDIAKFVFVIAGEVLLALKLDGVVDWKYLLVFFPFYMFEFVRLLQSMNLIRRASTMISKMVTLAYIESVMGKPYADLTEAEKEQLNEDYVIVHPAMTQMESEKVNVNDAELLEEQIKKSPEFEKADDVLRDAWKTMGSVLIHGALIALVVLRLDKAAFDISWWVVFIPVWSGAFLSCCYSFLAIGQAALPNDNMTVLYKEKEKVSPIGQTTIPKDSMKLKPVGTNEMSHDEGGGGNARDDIDEEMGEFVGTRGNVNKTNTSTVVPVMGDYESCSEIEISLSAEEPKKASLKCDISEISAKRLVVGTMEVSPTKSERSAPDSGSIRRSVHDISISRKDDEILDSPDNRTSVLTTVSSLSKVNSNESGLFEQTDPSEDVRELLALNTSHSNISFDTTSNSRASEATYSTAHEKHDDVVKDEKKDAVDAPETMGDDSISETPATKTSLSVSRHSMNVSTGNKDEQKRTLDTPGSNKTSLSTSKHSSGASSANRSHTNSQSQMSTSKHSSVGSGVTKKTQNSPETPGEVVDSPASNHSKHSTGSVSFASYKISAGSSLTNDNKSNASMKISTSSMGTRKSEGKGSKHSAGTASYASYKISTDSVEDENDQHDMSTPNAMSLAIQAKYPTNDQPSAKSELTNPSQQQQLYREPLRTDERSQVSNTWSEFSEPQFLTARTSMSDNNSQSDLSAVKRMYASQQFVQDAAKNIYPHDNDSSVASPPPTQPTVSNKGFSKVIDSLHGFHPEGAYVDGEDDDEEPFDYTCEAFQKEDDYDIMEALSHAFGNCCLMISYVTVISLFVGKLEGAGYSSFWVIFPLLVPAGILFCCFCCAVYCTPDLDALESISNPGDVQSDGYGERDYSDIEKGTDHHDDEKSVMSAAYEKAIELISVSSFNSKVSRFSGLD